MQQPITAITDPPGRVVAQVAARIVAARSRDENVDASDLDFLERWLAAATTLAERASDYPNPELKVLGARLHEATGGIRGAVTT